MTNHFVVVEKKLQKSKKKGETKQTGAAHQTFLGRVFKVWLRMSDKVRSMRRHSEETAAFSYKGKQQKD